MIKCIEMEERVFVSRDDLEGDLYQTLEDLLDIIIRPMFEWMGEGVHFGIIDTEDIEDGKLRIATRIEIYQEAPPNKQTESRDFIETYASVRKSVKTRLEKELTSIGEKTLLSPDLPPNGPRLYPDQFVIKTHNIDMEAFVTVNRGKRKVFLEQGIDIELVMSIEDISGFEPEGRQALYTKFNYLCSHNSLDSLDELRDWAQSLGIVYSGSSSKDQLCEV